MYTVLQNPNNIVTTKLLPEQFLPSATDLYLEGAFGASNQQR